MRSGRVLSALWAAIAVISITINGQSRGEQARNLQTLAVSGASNSTPSLVAEGRTVAAVWTATKDGSTMCISHRVMMAARSSRRRRRSTIRMAMRARPMSSLRE